MHEQTLGEKWEQVAGWEKSHGLWRAELFSSQPDWQKESILNRRVLIKTAECSFLGTEFKGSPPFKVSYFISSAF